LPPASLLQALFTASGYESKVAKTDLAAWLNFIKSIIMTYEIDDTKSVFEIGCGAGSFLYNIQDIAKSVGGADYCEALIEHAKQIIKSDDLSAVEAIAIPTEPKYDVVLAVGCCVYFPSKEYATQVLDVMVAKANKIVGIVDINDELKKPLAEKTRRENVGKDYDVLYAGLDHLYLSHEFFEDYAKKSGLRLDIMPHPLPCYPYRFNVRLSK
jgi:2-polyprenyl-3-methyl-5-hydroxy-6-metoxy-1,4-benzoquinol methylase